MALGNPFAAILTKTVRRNGAVVVAKGAKIVGRVDHIVRNEYQLPALASGADHCIAVILRPDRIEFDGRAGKFAANQVSRPFLNPSRLAHDPCPFEPEPGTAVLQFLGKLSASRAGKPCSGER